MECALPCGSLVIRRNKFDLKVLNMFAVEHAADEMPYEVRVVADGHRGNE